MKFKTIIVTFLSAAFLMTAPSAFSSDLTKACKSDLKKFGCKAKTDDEEHERLEKHEKEDAKNEGFSAKCYKAHEAFEKKLGKEEKEEHHEHDNARESH